MIGNIQSADDRRHAAEVWALLFQPDPARPCATCGGEHVVPEPADGTRWRFCPDCAGQWRPRS